MAGTSLAVLTGLWIVRQAVAHGAALAVVNRGPTAVDEIAQGKYLTGRYSPGYGDLPLELQPEILNLLDTSRRIGLMITGSVLMTPSKSVTAILGVTDRPPETEYNRSDDCRRRFNCELRKAGRKCWKA